MIHFADVASLFNEILAVAVGGGGSVGYVDEDAIFERSPRISAFHRAVCAGTLNDLFELFGGHF